MRKLLPIAILLLSSFSINSISAQFKSSFISTEEIGTLKCIYFKNVNANNVSEYGVDVIYKNQQFVYKQEHDEEKGFSITNPNYTIFKNKGYSDNNFIVIANKDLTIKAPINKFFANQLISWLNSIDFGKG